MRRRAAGGEAGFALVSVIAILAVLAILVTGFALASRHASALSRNAVEAARARAHAEAGIALALGHLLDPDPVQRWNANGTSHALTFDGAAIRVSLADEAGKLDLNWAPLELIGNLLAEEGVTADVAGGMLDAIAARRSTGSLPDLPPGERSGAALLGGPRLGDLAAAPFRLVEDLKALPGVTPEIFDRLRPFVTIYAQSRHIDPASAPAAVLSALPGVTAADAARIVASRLSSGGQQHPVVPDEALLFVGVGDPRVVTILAVTGTPAIERRAVVALTARPNQPYRILEWRQDFDE